MTVNTPRPEIERDRFGRPLVVPPGGGKPIPYTRCTTFVGSIEDTYNLGLWQQRMVAVGLSERPDLRVAVAAHKDDKAKLNELCEDALEAAKAHAAATTGTALHSFTEQLDRGQELRGVPEEYVADLAAYAKATEDLKAVLIEQFSVLDSLKIGGTPDRVVKIGGKRYIADLKTGGTATPERGQPPLYGHLKMAAQLAVYARSVPYDVVKHERLEPHGAELDKGIIIHLPAGEGVCQLYWIDLLEGWQVVRVSRDIREKRRIGWKALMQPFTAEAPPAYAYDGPTFGPGTSMTPPRSLADQIAAATTRDAVEALWRDHASEWTDDLTQLAKAHIAALAGSATAPATAPATEGAPA